MNQSLPYYDKAKKQVFGEGYSITYAGSHGRDKEILETFFYEDAHINFYFVAIRREWISKPGEIPSLVIFDKGLYSVIRLWCRDVSCVLKKEIPPDYKQIARMNILEGMMLMEGNSESPPKKIEFDRSAG